MRPARCTGAYGCGRPSPDVPAGPCSPQGRAAAPRIDVGASRPVRGRAPGCDRGRAPMELSGEIAGRSVDRAHVVPQPLLVPEPLPSRICLPRGTHRSRGNIPGQARYPVEGTCARKGRSAACGRAPWSGRPVPSGTGRGSAAQALTRLHGRLVESTDGVEADRPEDRRVGNSAYAAPRPQRPPRTARSPAWTPPPDARTPDNPAAARDRRASRPLSRSRSEPITECSPPGTSPENRPLIARENVDQSRARR